MTLFQRTFRMAIIFSRREPRRLPRRQPWVTDLVNTFPDGEIVPGETTYGDIADGDETAT